MKISMMILTFLLAATPALALDAEDRQLAILGVQILQLRRLTEIQAQLKPPVYRCWAVDSPYWNGDSEGYGPHTVCAWE